MPMNKNNKTALCVFISYAHADEAIKQRLDAHLAPLRRMDKIASWDDGAIVPGDGWDDRIKQKLAEADIILLLITADFINSQYIWEVELRKALQRDAAGEAIVIPIFCKACDFSGMPFARLQGLPKNAAPIALAANMDEALTNVAVGIRRAVDTKLGSPLPGASHGALSGSPAGSRPGGKGRRGWIALLGAGILAASLLLVALLGEEKKTGDNKVVEDKHTIADSGQTVKAPVSQPVKSLPATKPPAGEPPASTATLSLLKHMEGVRFIDGPSVEMVRSDDDLTFYAAQGHLISFNGHAKLYRIYGKMKLTDRVLTAVEGNVSGELSIGDNEQSIVGSLKIKAVPTPLNFDLQRMSPQ